MAIAGIEPVIVHACNSIKCAMCGAEPRHLVLYSIHTGRDGLIHWGLVTSWPRHQRSSGRRAPAAARPPPAAGSTPSPPPSAPPPATGGRRAEGPIAVLCPVIGFTEAIPTPQQRRQQLPQKRSSSSCDSSRPTRPPPTFGSACSQASLSRKARRVRRAMKSSGVSQYSLCTAGRQGRIAKQGGREGEAGSACVCE